MPQFSSENSRSVPGTDIVLDDGVKAVLTSRHLSNFYGADRPRRRRSLRPMYTLTIVMILLIICNTAWAETLVRVFAIRGFAGIVFSRGMNTLCDELSTIAQVDCTVEDFYDESAITANAADAMAAGQRLVLVGHSLGAHTALNIAAAMSQNVSLIVAIDANWFPRPRMPENAEVVLNYYQDFDVLGRARLRSSPAFHGELQNLLRHEPHIMIDDSPEIHAEIVARVKNILAVLALPPASLPMPPTPKSTAKWSPAR
jgi:hypothetical protein